LRITFLGTRGYVDAKSDRHRHRSSLLVEEGDDRVLIDFGDTFSPDDLKSIDPTAVIITHAHPDHLFGLKGLKTDIPVYLSNATLCSEYYKPEDYGGLSNVKTYQRMDSFKVGSLLVTSVPVEHSLKAPNVALFISNGDQSICYASDILSMKENHRRKYLSKCILYIGDLSSSKVNKSLYRRKDSEGFGHASPLTQMNYCADVGVRNVIFTHLGKVPIESEDEYYKSLLERSGDLNVVIAYDGMTVDLDRLSVTTEDIRDLLPKVLPEESKPKYGLYLVDPHPKLIWEGQKTAIVKTIPLKEHVDQPLYLLGKRLAYGIIVLEKPRVIDLDEFKDLEVYHIGYLRMRDLSGLGDSLSGGLVHSTTSRLDLSDDLRFPDQSGSHGVYSTLSRVRTLSSLGSGIWTP